LRKCCGTFYEKYVKNGFFDQNCSLNKANFGRFLQTSNSPKKSPIFGRIFSSKNRHPLLNFKSRPIGEKSPNLVTLALTF
jgi:hypothetical protein